MKNDVFGDNFEYIGNNTFQYPGVPPETKINWTLRFEIMTSGSVKLTQTSVNEKGENDISVAVREK